MDPYVVRRKSFQLIGLALAVTLVACGDKRVRQLTMGITRDSAVTIIARGYVGPHDSFPNVYTRAGYLEKGKFYEVLYYTPDNAKYRPSNNPSSRDSISWKKLTPLVFYENKLIAKDWSTWDSISKSLNIPLKDRSK